MLLRDTGTEVFEVLAIVQTQASDARYALMHFPACLYPQPPIPFLPACPEAFLFRRQGPQTFKIMEAILMGVPSIKRAPVGAGCIDGGGVGMLEMWSWLGDTDDVEVFIRSS